MGVSKSFLTDFSFLGFTLTIKQALGYGVDKCAHCPMSKESKYQ